VVRGGEFGAEFTLFLAAASFSALVFSSSAMMVSQQAVYVSEVDVKNINGKEDFNLFFATFNARRGLSI
jgi:hypothetical protein